MDACSTTDVLICGAGAAGLTLALDLARRGVSLRIVEKGQQPFQGSRGKGIQPRTLEVFEDLGIVDRIAAAGGLYPTLREYRDDGSYSDSAVVEDAKPTPAEPYTMPLMVPQFLTERVMRTRLTELGTQVEFGRELVSFEQDETGITARVASNAEPEVIRARYLVGADGGRSFIRQALDIGFPGKTLDIRAVVADLHLTGLTRDAWHRFGEGDMDKQLALCPLLGTDLFQLQAPVPLDGDIDVSVAGLQSMIATRSGRSDIRVQSVSWASAYKMSARLADHYRSGRIFLVGDAAHVHPPTGGQGLNTSVQDAYNLGWKLAAVLSGASDALLDTYEAERRPIAAGILGLSTRLLDAHKRGDMRRGREVRQLDLAYPESALALEEPTRDHGIAPGDRAPDATVRGRGGQQLRLFELFKGPHWTLIGQDADAARIAPRAGLHIHTFGQHGDLIDEGEHFHDAYGLASREWVLVRPDGYVGALIGASAIESLEDYLRKWLPP